MISAAFFRRGGWRPLLYLTFCIYLVREIIFLSGKSQGILKTDVCPPHKIGIFTLPNIFFFFTRIQYLDHIKHSVIENIKCLTGAPSVQMQEVPPDFMCLEAMEDQEDPDARQDEDSR